MRGRFLILSSLTATLALGCGQPLVPLSTYEAPLGALAGYLDPQPSNGFGALRVGVLWVDPAQLRDDVPAPAAGQTFTALDDVHFTLDLFTPPPALAIRRYPSATSTDVAVAFAFGEIIVYEDNDGDGTFAVTPRAAGALSMMVGPDLFRGSTPNYALLYLEQPGSADAGPVGAAWPVLFDDGTGYRLAAIDCTTLDRPVLRKVDTSTPLMMDIEAHGSTTLISTRQCLRSMPVQQPTPP
jgi:hypothetical protein